MLGGLFIKITVLLKWVSLIFASCGKCHRQGLLDIVCLADVKMQLKDCKTQIFLAIEWFPNQVTLRIIRKIVQKTHPRLNPGLLNQNAKSIHWAWKIYVNSKLRVIFKIIEVISVSKNFNGLPFSHFHLNFSH